MRAPLLAGTKAGGREIPSLDGTLPDHPHFNVADKQSCPLSLFNLVERGMIPYHALDFP